MLVQCSSDARLMLNRYYFNYSAKIVMECSQRPFWVKLNAFRLILQTFPTMIWIDDYFNSMLIQCSSDARLILNQHYFNYSAEIVMKWARTPFWVNFECISVDFTNISENDLDLRLFLVNAHQMLVQCSSNAHQILFQMFC